MLCIYLYIYVMLCYNIYVCSHPTQQNDVVKRSTHLSCTKTRLTQTIIY